MYFCHVYSFVQSQMLNVCDEYGVAKTLCSMQVNLRAFRLALLPQ